MRPASIPTNVARHWNRITARVPTDLGRRLVRALPVILVIAVLTAIVQPLGVLHQFEAFGLDVANIAGHTRDPRHVTLVAITDEEHRQAPFYDRVHMRPEALDQVIAAVAQAHPLAIGIDIETTRETVAKLHIPRDAPPIGWARGEMRNEAFGLNSGAGLNAFLVDSDFVVRRYAFGFETEGGTIPSFATAVLGACERAGDLDCRHALDGRARNDAEPRIIDYAQLRLGAWNSAFAMTFTALQKYIAHPDPSSDPFRGRIVIVGGQYDRDHHPTPVGDAVHGYEIWGQILENELNGRARIVNEPLAFGVDILCGLLLVAVAARMPFAAAIAIGLFAIPLVSFAASIVAFETSALWFNFVPMTVGVYAHLLRDHAQEYAKLRKEHEQPA